MKHLLIIGGTGFFGKSILDSFRRGMLEEFQIQRITLIARRKDRFVQQYADLLTPEIQIIEGDIATMTSLPLSDIVIHAATSTNFDDYALDGEMALEQIQNSMRNFVELIRSNGKQAKVVLCSSGAVYGKQPLDLEVIPETFPLPDDFSALTLGKQWYLQGKRLAEEHFIHLGQEQMQVAIARCFSFSGKYLPKDKQYALGNFIGAAELGKEIVVEAPGVVYRSYMHADDLVKSLLIIADAADKTCPIFNVGSDVSISLYDLAESIAKKYCVTCTYVNLDRGKILDRYVPNTNKLKKLILDYYK